jgi:cytochrome c-type biogenesis protein CcmH/NrfF
MRSELASLIDQGKNHDEIIQAFISTYGSEEMLGAPIDKGFNRLAWLLPYLLGAGGAIGIGAIAVRWTRHADGKIDPMPAPADAELEERLNDELSNLD